MAKVKTAYVCSDCGASALQWFGSCPSCGAAGTLNEAAAERRGGTRSASRAVPLEEVEIREVARTSSGIAELDRTLGGGLVPGQVTLLGGDPGIGKSTLLLQCLATLSGSTDTVYVSGEESADQIALRARRLALPLKGLPRNAPSASSPRSRRHGRGSQ
jgi:DNA repair protein RadA/Sms